MYRLNQKVQPNGWSVLQRCIFFSNDLQSVKEELKKKILSGVPLEDLSISKDVEFDFKCAVVISAEKEEV